MVSLQAGIKSPSLRQPAALRVGRTPACWRWRRGLHCLLAPQFTARGRLLPSSDLVSPTCLCLSPKVGGDAAGRPQSPRRPPWTLPSLCPHTGCQARGPGSKLLLCQLLLACRTFFLPLGVFSALRNPGKAGRLTLIPVPCPGDTDIPCSRLSPWVGCQEAQSGAVPPPML